MKYVDEFRDRDKATALVREITALAGTIRSRRPIQIMEVCGGHTHAIFRYGIEGMLPEQIELVHGPGCPVCVLPMGRIDDCIAIAARAGRDPHHVRRRHARAGLARQPAAGEGQRRRYPHGVFADPTRWHWRGRIRIARWCSSVSASRPRCRPPR